MNPFAATPPAQVLLLVEDNPGDAMLVSELLHPTAHEQYDVLHVPQMAAAVQALRTRSVDVVVLDLRLPDCAGVDAVRAVRKVTSEVPIVVLTGNDDDRLAMECIDAGAQDYLPKSEVRERNLRRAIGYAIKRIRDAQVRHLQETLARYRTLSSAAQRTSVTAALVGAGPISQRNPQTFASAVKAYYALLEPYLVHHQERVEASHAEMEVIVTLLGDAGSGPRDLLDVHVAALDQALALHLDPHARSIVFESRLLALEMMGLLVDYYRVGHRRRFLEDLQ